MGEKLEKALEEIQTLAGVVSFVQDPKAGARLKELSQIVEDYKASAKGAAEDREASANQRDEASRLLRESQAVQAQTYRIAEVGVAKQTTFRDEAFRLRDSALQAQGSADQKLEEVKRREEALAPRTLALVEREATLEALQKETEVLRKDLDRRLALVNEARK